MRNSEINFADCHEDDGATMNPMLFFPPEMLRKNVPIIATREGAMSEDLNKLLEVAKRFTPTPEHREEQRRSFAYGNTAFENQLITRDMIDEQAERLAAEKNEHQRK